MWAILLFVLTVVIVLPILIGVLSTITNRESLIVSFDGSGYTTVPSADSQAKDDLELKIKTRATTEQLVLLKKDARVDFAITVAAGGKVNLSYDDNNRIVNISSTSDINDGEWHKIKITHDERITYLFIDDTRENMGDVVASTAVEVPNSLIYLGGAPSASRGINIPTANYVGCIKDVKINGVLINEYDLSSSGVSLGCNVE